MGFLSSYTFVNCSRFFRENTLKRKWIVEEFQFIDFPFAVPSVVLISYCGSTRLDYIRLRFHRKNRPLVEMGWLSASFFHLPTVSEAFFQATEVGRRRANAQNMGNFSRSSVTPAPPFIQPHRVVSSVPTSIPIF